MTPDQFREARLRLGLTQSEMADRLGIDGEHRARTVRRWESGERAIPGPVALLLNSLFKSSPVSPAENPAI